MVRITSYFSKLLHEVSVLLVKPMLAARGRTRLEAKLKNRYARLVKGSAVKNLASQQAKGSTEAGAMFDQFDDIGE
jgi:hypothetical protein